MITGELKSKIDAVWNDFWSGGIANPLEVMEQLTYLPFIKGLGERQTKHPTTDNRQRDAHSFRVARSDPDVRIRSSPHSTHLRSPLRVFQWRSRRPAEALEIATGTVQVDLAMGADEIDWVALDLPEPIPPRL